MKKFIAFAAVALLAALSFPANGFLVLTAK